jgi:hypothetical protein
MAQSQRPLYHLKAFRFHIIHFCDFWLVFHCYCRLGDHLCRSPLGIKSQGRLLFQICLFGIRDGGDSKDISEDFRNSIPI